MSWPGGMRVNDTGLNWQLRTITPANSQRLVHVVGLHSPRTHSHTYAHSLSHTHRHSKQRLISEAEEKWEGVVEVLGVGVEKKGEADKQWLMFAHHARPDTHPSPSLHLQQSHQCVCVCVRGWMYVFQRVCSRLKPIQSIKWGSLNHGAIARLLTRHKKKHRRAHFTCRLKSRHGNL